MISEAEVRRTMPELLQRTAEAASQLNLMDTVPMPQESVAVTNATWFTDPVSGRRVYCALVVVVAESLEAAKKDGANSIEKWR